jgi:hypothetical protein
MHNLRLKEGANTEDFLKTCMANEIVRNEIVECLIEKPTCYCFLNYGNAKYCQHSLKFDIAKRTQELNETRK